MEYQIEGQSESQKRDRFNNWVAISLAILAAFMAITKVKDDNIVQTMLQAKTDAVDTWSQYQAKKLKHHILELGRDQAKNMRYVAAAQFTKYFNDQIKNYDAEILRYENEEKALQEKAHSYEELYDALNYRDDQFDLSDALLNVSLATLAVTSLTRKKWLFIMSLTFGGLGALMGLAGLIGLKIHPDWIIKLLT